MAGTDCCRKFWIDHLFLFMAEGLECQRMSYGIWMNLCRNLTMLKNTDCSWVPNKTTFIGVITPVTFIYTAMYRGYKSNLYDRG